MSKVSVIIPIYNSEKYIEECVRSILKQSFSDFELLLIDDGSTDNSPSILKTLRDSDDRIKLISQNNKGVSVARNQGILHSTGEYICFVDSDDFVDSNYIENMLKQICDCDAYLSGFKYLYSNGSVVEKGGRISEGKYLCDDFSSLIIDDGSLTGILFGSVCGCLYKNAIIKENLIAFREDVAVNEDGIFNIEFFQKADSVFVSNSSMYYYRQYKLSKKRELVLDSSKLDGATQVIAEICHEYPDYTIQMTRRSCSVIFWIALGVRNTSDRLFKCCRELRRFLNNHKKQCNYRALDLSKVNGYKRVLIFLLSHGLTFLFTVAVKYIAPLFYTKVKH